MDGENEQWVAIKFCLKAGLSATETLVLVLMAYGNEALNRSKVLDGILDFETEGNWQKMKRVVAVQIDSNWDKHGCCCWFGQKWPSNRIKNDCRIFEHPQNCSSSDFESGFGKRKLCARFVPHSLTPEQREDRVTSCQDIIAMADADKKLFNKIITAAESWCLAYDPETNWQISEWVGETSPRPKTLKFQTSFIKIVLIIFSTLTAKSKTVRTTGKNTKCRIL